MSINEQISNLELFKKIQDYFKVSEQESTILYFLKAFLLVFIGVSATTMINEFISEQNQYGILFLILTFVAAYTYYKIEKLSILKKINFPLSLIEHLSAVENLSYARKDLKRKIIIDDYIDNSIKALNLNTCNVEYGADPEICKNGLKEGLSSVINDLIERTHYILNINNSKFSVGIYFQELAEKKNEYVNGESITVYSDFIILRDDLNLQKYLPKDLNEPIQSKDLSFKLHNYFSEVLLHNKIVFNCIDIEKIGHSIIVSPIQAVCEADLPIGFIYIIVDDQIQIEQDIENILQIFGRILSNWIDKYNNCVYDHYTHLKYKRLGIFEIIEEREQYGPACCGYPSSTETTNINEDSENIPQPPTPK